MLSAATVVCSKPNWQLDDVDVRLVDTEVDLLKEVAVVVRDYDVDVLLPWDARASLGFLIDRAAVLGIEPPLLRQLGRTPDHRGMNEESHDEWGERTNTGISIVGRIVLNVWRCARTELAITSFTLEAVAAKVLQERVPAYSNKTLTQWWELRAQDEEQQPAAAGGERLACADDLRVRVFSHYARRASLTHRISEVMEMIQRTSELARVFGIDFTSVITRGSQYRVESMLLRLCRSQGFAVASPETQQVRQQAAPQSIALVMEPEGKFYTSPVIVLDFRSLYPSVIIAYNYCYSTCLGPIRSLTTMLDGGVTNHRFGCLDLSVRGFCTKEEARQHRTPAAQLHATLTRLSNGRPLCPETAEEQAAAAAAAVERPVPGSAGSGESSGPLPATPCGLHAAPNGVLFTSSSSRPGVLPRLLREILETRFMVKRAMKQVPVGSPLHRTLNARQFGLKLIANVTYGYTSASFSGRMPNVHIADAIVQTGRDTLQRTIELVDNHPTWGAKVVYGDTDSLFVLVEGRSRPDAFKIGRDIARTVTEINPHPMELELEKVYHPCVLCTKKRYVGWSYESEKGPPKFDAKGIETVRRDGCAAERKVLEKCLRLLFTSADLSAVKSYLLRQCDKLQSGRASLLDYVFATEVRLGTYKSNETAPPGAQVALHRQQVDPNDKIQLGERVPYVVINRHDGDLRLRNSAQRPEIVLFPSPTVSAFTGGTSAAGLGVPGPLQFTAPELNAAFYILKRILPAMDRVFSLIGIDVFHWYKLEMRRSKRPPLDRPLPSTGQRGATVVGYFDSEHCVLCDKQCRGLLCEGCKSSRQNTAVALHTQPPACREAIRPDCPPLLGLRKRPRWACRVPQPRLPAPVHSRQARPPRGNGGGASRGAITW